MLGASVVTWAVFGVLAMGAVLVDAGAFGSRALSLRAALWRSLVYVGVSVAFGGYLYAACGADAASRFFSGYAMEKALSVDNLMAFVAVFSYFGIPRESQPRILRWGLVGAVVFRLLFVAAGAGSLVRLGRPVEALFGLVVAWSAIAMVRGGGGDREPVDHRTRWYARFILRFSTLWFDDSGAFFRKVGSRWCVTEAFCCLVAIEVTDVVFSFDSVPAVIAVTQEPLLVYSAMVFAILGLRALYLLVDALARYLEHLGKAVVVVLVFIAAKLLLHAGAGVTLTPTVSLAIVLGVLGIGAVASIPSAALEAEKSR